MSGTNWVDLVDDGWFTIFQFLTIDNILKLQIVNKSLKRWKLLCYKKIEEAFHRQKKELEEYLSDLMKRKDRDWKNVFFSLDSFFPYIYSMNNFKIKKKNENRTVFFKHYDMIFKEPEPMPSTVAYPYYPYPIVISRRKLFSGTYRLTVDLVITSRYRGGFGIGLFHDMKGKEDDPVLYYKKLNQYVRDHARIGDYERTLCGWIGAERVWNKRKPGFSIGGIEFFSYGYDSHTEEIPHKFINSGKVSKHSQGWIENPSGKPKNVRVEVFVKLPFKKILSDERNPEKSKMGKIRYVIDGVDYKYLEFEFEVPIHFAICTLSKECSFVVKRIVHL